MHSLGLIYNQQLCFGFVPWFAAGTNLRTYWRLHKVLPQQQRAWQTSQRPASCINIHEASVFSVNIWMLYTTLAPGRSETSLRPVGRH